MKVPSKLFFHMTCFGVDGCFGGWVSASITGENVQFEVFPDFAQLYGNIIVARGGIVCVDIPIGLIDGPRCDARECDKLARKMLPGKTSSVFNPPSRLARTAPKESLGSLGMSPFGIAFAPKVYEVDDLMTPEIQSRLVESHPELAFAELNGGPILNKKRELGGMLDRLKILDEKLGWKIDPKTKIRGAAMDDLLDAAVLLHVATKIASGTAKTIPDVPSIDSRGLRMEMWF